MVTDAIALSEKIKDRFEQYKDRKQFKQVAKLITYSLQILPRKYNRHFGYIPSIFRQIELYDCAIASNDIYFDEPVIYKLYYPDRQRLYELPYFYIFCYLKQNSQQLNVYFQSAHPKHKSLTQQEYNIDCEKISFEGSMSAFDNNNISVISVSDPGQFIPGMTSSYYVGSPELNLNKTIANVLEKISKLAEISLQNTMLFGSSAGTFGALLSSTYLSQKTNVIAVNSQINLQDYKALMLSLLGLAQPKLLRVYGDRISCMHRFQQNLVSIPNIYLLANINDNLHQKNFEFYQLLISKFSRKGINNQFVFDSYYGIEGHGRPQAKSLRAKIRIAREILTMKSNL